jgi:hypothetical protein
VAGLHLVLFALAIMPKIVLHALVANHRDTHPGLIVHGDQLNEAGFHCDTDNLVVEFPFVPASPVPSPIAGPSNLIPSTAALQEPLASSHPLFGLRGPPAACNA